MSKAEKIKKALDEQLTNESQELYANLLNERIEENRKSMSRLSVTLFLCYFAFPLISEAMITEISFGPFTLSDNLIAIGIIPSIFAFTYYKYITVWINLVEQKATYKVLISMIFAIGQDSFLNQKLSPYSFLDSVSFYQLQEKSKKLGCLINFFWIPIALIIIVFPFVFEYYMIATLIDKFGFNTWLKKVIIITPVLIGFFTFLIIFQTAKKDFDKHKYD